MQLAEKYLTLIEKTLKIYKARENKVKFNVYKSSIIQLKEGKKGRKSKNNNPTQYAYLL